jgi:hypothetical protein
MFVSVSVHNLLEIIFFIPSKELNVYEWYMYILIFI